MYNMTSRLPTTPTTTPNNRHQQKTAVLLLCCCSKQQCNYHSQSRGHNTHVPAVVTFACTTTTNRPAVSSCCSVGIWIDSVLISLTQGNHNLRHSSRMSPATTREDNSSSSRSSSCGRAFPPHSTPYTLPISCCAKAARPALRRKKTTETPQNLKLKSCPYPRQVSHPRRRAQK